jgi:CheY-like chemotaxis protein
MQVRSVLVIEDSESLRLILNKILSKAGYQVLLAKGGAEALEFLKLHKVHFIISDLDMPTGDGPSFLAFLREKKVKIPTLILTGYTEATVENYASYGVTALLHKPIEAHVIESILKFLNPTAI